jgi:hypothetical protein
MHSFLPNDNHITNLGSCSPSCYDQNACISCIEFQTDATLRNSDCLRGSGPRLTRICRHRRRRPTATDATSTVPLPCRTVKVLRIANSSRTEEDSFFSSSCNSAKNENSGIPSMEYDVTAKSDASLAITALLSCTLRAGIFLSNETVASIGKMEDNVMPVCQALMGWTFQISIPSLTSSRAAMVSSSSFRVDSHGFLSLMTLSDTSVTRTTAMVANLVPTKMDFPRAGSRAF